jgi:FSR family fosmidomycin resistance protein-like MFS transporter
VSLVEPLGTAGLLALLVPTGIICALLSGRFGGAPASPHAAAKGKPSFEGRDDWRAFWLLSGATVTRSIVFYGINTFLALYFMSRWGLTAAGASWAPIVFLGTSIVGTLLGGWLGDRSGRRAVLRIGFVGATVFFTIFLQAQDRNVALALLVPLAIFIFMPTSVLVVLGQEYLPHRVGTASGVTLGLAVSVGGMCAPLLGRVGDHYGMDRLFLVLLGVLALAAAQTFSLPPVGRLKRSAAEYDLEVPALIADR